MKKTASRKTPRKPRKPPHICYSSPMSRRTACTGPYAVDRAADSWKAVTCPACLAKQPDIAVAYARYCGTEFEANLGNSRMRDYLDDCALQFGVDDWDGLPAPQKHIVRNAFDAGRAAERAAIKGTP